MGFFEMTFELFFDWPLGTIIAILLAGVVLFVVMLILYLIFIAVDSWFLPLQMGYAKITNKIHTPSETTVNYNVALKMPMVSSTPADWELTLQVGDQCDTVSVGIKFFKNIKIGEHHKVAYVYGRCSGNLYIKELY